VTLVAAQTANIDLLALFEVAGSNSVGVTVVRTHLALYITTTVSPGDDLRVALGVFRLSDIGQNVLGAISPSTPELPWALWKHEFAAPTFATGGSNVLEYDLKSRRRIRGASETYGLALNSASGKTVKIAARVLLQLP